MKVGRRSVFLVLLVALAGLVLFLSLRNPQPPMLPDDDTHAVFVSAEECLFCHGPDGGLPRGPNHPISRQCMSCHGR